MSEPTIIRPRLQGGGAVVLALLKHPMESGQRKDAAGKTVPAWHITEVRAAHNGRTVLSAQWGPAVSKNPLLRFTLKAASAGDTIAVSWVDNRGDSRTDQVLVG